MGSSPKQRTELAVFEVLILILEVCPSSETWSDWLWRPLGLFSVDRVGLSEECKAGVLPVLGTESAVG